MLWTWVSSAFPEYMLYEIVNSTGYIWKSICYSALDISVLTRLLSGIYVMGIEASFQHWQYLTSHTFFWEGNYKDESRRKSASFIKAAHV